MFKYIELLKGRLTCRLKLVVAVMSDSSSVVLLVQIL